MTTIPMTQAEFNTISTELKAADPAEIAINVESPTNGQIQGTKPIRWSADYTFTGSALDVHGHGLFGGRIESDIADRLNQSLTTMRGATA